MNTAHTPGPFVIGPVSHRAESASQTFERFVCSVSALNSQSAVCGYAQYFTVYGASMAECEANARLIAAAPELLSEVRYALAALEGRANPTAAIKGLRAAITKAEGTR